MNVLGRTEWKVKQMVGRTLPVCCMLYVDKNIMYGNLPNLVLCCTDLVLVVVNVLTLWTYGL
jgi:hypothetical protein